MWWPDVLCLSTVFRVRRARVWILCHCSFEFVSMRESLARTVGQRAGTPLEGIVAEPTNRFLHLVHSTSLNYHPINSWASPHNPAPHIKSAPPRWSSGRRFFCKFQRRNKPMQQKGELRNFTETQPAQPTSHDAGAHGCE